MIKGIGIDLIELNRIQEKIEHNERFIKRILTDKEQELYSSLTGVMRKVEYLAGRFAAKEAFAKAAGTGIGKLSFQHIEILPNEQGAPRIIVQGFNDDNIFISITHSKEYAMAQVVIEDNN
ncbi:holo-ACP synthase [Virgibacillus oceani]|uniref:Holo-[acyl-carrier-protein] synthase n=1 Tax=Virgibacillus oceani TaxID=1479511 RepID=A0A917HQS3_9BACI|nr:holo-ACP synthase [Virgibacillus oceani]GGG87643.1 holo-[acyl-carrier-protein] synthase [Virgibacillus oceani]